MKRALLLLIIILGVAFRIWTEFKLWTVHPRRRDGRLYE